MSDNIGIQELRDAAANVPIEIPEERDYLLSLADDAEWRQSRFIAIRTEALAIANPRRDAKEHERAELLRARDSDTPLTAKLWNKFDRGDFDRTVPDPLRLLEAGQAARFGDEEQKLFVWKNELLANDLLTPAEARAIDWTIGPSPAALERRREEQRELDRLIKLREQILLKIPAGWDRSEALTEWNVIGGYMDANKINQWIERCRTKGLLGIEWLPARRLGALVQRLLHGKEEVSNVHFK